MTSGRHEGRCEGGSARRRMSRSFLLYLVQKLETVTFERQRQYSSLFGRLEADINSKFVNYDDWVPPLSHLLDITHMTLSPKPFPSVFAYCKQSKTGVAWERGYNRVALFSASSIGSKRQL